MIGLLLAVSILAQAPAGPVAAEHPRPFVISVVDDQTGRGVPLVELTTVNQIRLVTDSAGLAVFDEPGLFGQDVFFSLRSYGYEFPRDGFGNRGKAIKVVPSGQEKLRIRRVNLAERVYRQTGGGIYRDTILAGRTAPIREPLLNAKVLGQDSVLTAVFGGKIHWFWGDTLKPGYPLGNYHSPGATSLLPSRGGLDPDVGVDLTYFTDETGFARPTAKLPGPGPTWLSGVTVIREPSGRERMFATYDKIRNMLETYERGMVEWDEAKKEFAKIAEFPLDAPTYAQGHPFLHKVGDAEYVYFSTPFPFTRVRANAASITDLSQYEAFTPFVAGSRREKYEVERDSMGRVVYGWKRNTPPAGPVELLKLIAKKSITKSESLAQIRDESNGRAVLPHRGSVNWNAFRRRWVMIFTESGEDFAQSVEISPLGEIYFAEADTPLGPWRYARKVVTHRDGDLRYSFYNPKHHPFFDKDGGKTIFFEGTYTTSFSGNDDPTPRYDYNQVMYKLDLGRPEVSLPVPVYELSEAGAAGPISPAGGDLQKTGRPIAFYALDRPGIGTQPIYAAPNAAGGMDLSPGRGPGEPLFHGVPFESKSTPPTSTPLLEFVHDDGIRHAYSTDIDWKAPGFRRTGRIVCHVWSQSSRLILPRE
ncbi:MAG: hypothetical protein JWN86_4523 [Planctomycetota bacterium]|nr:hypothetical protein [Planctomycetota bacterium]